MALTQVDGGLLSPTNAQYTDYQQFKQEVLAGEATLEDADGNSMTPDGAKAFLATLP